MLDKLIYNSIAIIGATATGKTQLGVAIATCHNGEIISCDSRQVYKELTLGSGKDLDEYKDIPYHLIDICDLSSEYTVFDFQKDCIASFNKIMNVHHLPILVGGTGLYLNAIFNSYQLIPVPENHILRTQLSSYTQEELANMLIELNPHLHNKTDLSIRERTVRAIEIALFKKENHSVTLNPNPIRPLIFKINFERDILRPRIRKRLKQRIDDGMIDEVAHILAHNDEDRILRLGLEYRYTTQFLKGEYTFDEYFEKLFIAICQFAKRQETWFRKMQREGLNFIDLSGSNVDEMKKTVTSHIFQNKIIS